MNLSWALTTLLCFTAIISFSQKKVLFQVDISELQIPKDSTPIVGLRGSIHPLTWVKNIDLTDEDNDGIFQASVSFPENSEGILYFMYVLNNKEWEAGDARNMDLTSDNPSIQSIFRYSPPIVNPFHKFIGEWTLQNDLWIQGTSADKLDTIDLPNHYTKCSEINTHQSLLWEVESTSATGHALWTYNQFTKELSSQTSFYQTRIGHGTGKITEHGDVNINMFFEGSEPEGTYRQYSYEWLDENTYVLRSYQYDSEDQPTGNFYGGTFIRIQ